MFNVYEFCSFNFYSLKTCTAFILNEAVLKFAKLPCLIQEKKVECKGKQINLKTELKLLNNLNLFCFIKQKTIYQKKKFIV
jgi:hypothetical protein